MTKEDARKAMDKARDERDAAYARVTKNPSHENEAVHGRAIQKYIAARDYYTSKWPRFV